MDMLERTPGPEVINMTLSKHRCMKINVDVKLIMLYSFSDSINI